MSPEYIQTNLEDRSSAVKREGYRIVLFYKPGKDPTDNESHIPMALLSFVEQLMEKTVVLDEIGI